ncbi:DUF3325 family protein [Sphingomonas sp. HT-1]|jgi:hypothetical protein|uniref:DUF3325 family protein n=1 Tax=unclassified Sphingomonas TaxID=196159 RepID=UPI0002DEAFDF|nr:MULTISPECIES: DUF3325 family protein [unclassified Sphingomonas]KTF68302.1 hypothetical protein ATB93_14710 [Sphingomonas sp. WG]
MIAAGLTVLGFFALAAAMPRHAPALLGPAGLRLPSHRLRFAGWAALLAALAACLCAPSWPLALVTWVGLLPLAAALILLGLTYDARLARGAAALGVLAVVAGLVG